MSSKTCKHYHKIRRECDIESVSSLFLSLRIFRWIFSHKHTAGARDRLPALRSLSLSALHPSTLLSSAAAEAAGNEARLTDQPLGWRSSGGGRRGANGRKKLAERDVFRKRERSFCPEAGACLSACLPSCFKNYLFARQRESASMLSLESQRVNSSPSLPLSLAACKLQVHALCLSSGLEQSLSPLDPRIKDT